MISLAITIDFSKEFADLICIDIPKVQTSSYPRMELSEKYRKQFIHPENGFVKLFCEEYDESSNNK